MALRGRRIAGSTSIAASGSLVILNEVSKSGMIRSLKFVEYTSMNSATLRIEIDGELYAYGTPTYLLSTDGDTNNQALGAPMVRYGDYVSTVSHSISRTSRILNIPFTNSARITIIANVASTHNYNIEYVVDID